MLIAFKRRPAGVVYPTLMMKNAVNRAAIQARNIVRIANDMLATVVLLRRPESALFTNTMARHFNLIAGDLGGGLLVDNTVDRPFSFQAVMQHDRRWVLERIREQMLSLSFHLNTGVYLIDMDTAARTVQGGAVIPVGTSIVADGYVHQRGDQGKFYCGFRNGEIHVDFNDFPNYSLNSCARVIIHEAAHKYLGIPDHLYANDVNYPPTLTQCMSNADSVAWTAVSLATGSVKLPAGITNDWNHCPGIPL